MVLKQEVINAFNTLGLDPASTTVEQATTAYKKLALKHHPDRNFGDSTANERFQEIGEAWSICQRHFEYPTSSQVGAEAGFGNFTSGRTYTADDEVPLDEFEAFAFFQFVFHEVFLGRYTHARGQRYRSQRAGADGGGVFTFSGGFAEAQRRQAENAARQAREHEEYKNRVREFEREQAEEQAEIDRLAREEARDQARLASAQNNAFQLGKEGKGAEMRSLIEKFNLDVTKPRKLNTKKDVKAGKEINFETMLHVAAGSCDEALIDWLLVRGADPAALDSSGLTPFHVAILRGNTPVARHLVLLYRNTKSTDPRYQSFCDGCHPSKAAKDKNGSTPLQLAIKSKKLDIVELLLKDATVHNVERCWAQLEEGEQGGQIGNVLLAKNGFKPPELNGVAAQRQTMSKKAIRKLKQAEDERKANEEKARRLAEEEENRLKKQARREKTAKEEAERQAKREAEERMQIEEAVEEERRRQAKQEQARKEAQERARREAEEHARQEAEAREQRTEERRREAAREAKQKLREKEAAAKQTAKAALAKQREIEAASARRAKAEAEAARLAQRQAELQREEEQRLKAEKLRAMQEQEERIQRENARLKAEAETRLQQEAANRIQRDEEAAQARKDAQMRRRAEQSARDKARNQRIREERAKAQAMESVVTPPTPSTPTSKTSLHQDTPTATKSKRSKPASSSGVSVSEPPPVPLHTRPKAESSYARPPPALLSPPMTPEDLQTIPIPEDLFRYEPPVTAVKDSATSSPALNAPSPRARGRAQWHRRGPTLDVSGPVSAPEAGESEHIGNGVPCRYLHKRGGCARGAQCGFSHMATPRARHTALEEELAKKNLEIEHMRAELAAAKARAS